MTNRNESRGSRWWFLGLLAVALLGGFVMIFYGPSLDEPPRYSKGTDGEPHPYEQGEQLYRRYCSTCHGTAGDGEGPAGHYLDPPPMDFHSDTAATRSEEELYKVTTEGKLSTGMPAWEGTLSDQQRRAIVRYIRRAFIEDSAETLPQLRD